MPRYGRVVLGGTFDRLHVGHEALLATAFRAGRTVAIGLTTARFLAAHPKPRGRAIASEGTRRTALVRWLRRHYPGRRWTVVPLEDRFGGSVEEGVDALVVSADSLKGGRAVNRERRRLGRSPVPLLTVPLVLADDLEPVSSRRIRAGEIDRNGRRRGRMPVVVTVSHATDLAAARRAVRRAFPTARLRARALAGEAGPAVRVARGLARSAGDPAGLGVGVARRRGGWVVVVRGRRVELYPTRIAGRAAATLETGLAELLRRNRR